MVKYTISDKANKVVETHMGIIKKIIIKDINPISIILFGGFGRGEGSFEIIRGKINPLNDYDMYVITKNKISEDLLEEIGMKCSNAIGKGGKEFAETPFSNYDKNEFFHVDLRCIRYNELKRLMRINRTYELKYGSTIIYGEDVRKLIKIDSLPLSESFRYLINPACQLILCMDSRRFKGGFKKDERQFAMHHIVKTYLACASSLLISEGKFEPNYRRTNEAVKKIYGTRFPELVKRIDEATNLKINPKKEIGNINERWFQAREDLTFVLKYISKKHLGIEEEDIIKFTSKLYNKLPYTYFTPYLPFGPLSKFAFPAQYALNLLYFKRSGYVRALFDWRDVGLKMAMAAFVLLYALDNPDLAEVSYSQIKSFYPVKSKDWEDLRASLLYAFERYFSQKLI
ncbi:MAG: hypothetical protein V1660_04550 [archaeon]